MYNVFLKPTDLNVKVNDRVAVDGYRGTVLEVFKGVDFDNGKEYTCVRVHFDNDEHIAKYGQYQNGVYGNFTVIG